MKNLLLHLNRYSHSPSSFLRPTSNLPGHSYFNSPGYSSSIYNADFLLSGSSSFCNHPYAARKSTADISPDSKSYSTVSQKNYMNMTSATMERGIGGRIEDAFAAAKDRGEAAFVSFVTAGYPTSQGEYYFCDD